MHMPAPLTRDVVLIGGGHTHALVLRAWGMAPVAGARLTLIDPNPTAAYSGMLPGHVAGHYDRSELEIDLVRLARFAGARLVLGAACGLDAEAREIHVPGRAPIVYDIASVDVGITSAMPDLPGFPDHGVPAKPLGPFADRWARFVSDATAGRVPPAAAVIGAGVAGVELALAMAHRLRAAGCDDARVTLLEADRMLGALPAAARRALRAEIDATGIRLLERAAVSRVTAAAVELADGRTLPCAFCAGTAGTRPHGWLADSGLALTEGFIDVDDRLRSTSHRELFAAGDCAHMTFAPRPKAGVYAVRQAPVLAHNLRAALVGMQARRYRPQRDYLKLISLGRRSALVQKGALTLQGPWLWRLKNRIDRDFMDRFRHLSPMRPALPTGDAARGARGAAAAPLCGGCGAKVAASGLSGALAQLPAPDTLRDDVLSRPGDDAAVLAFGATRQVLTTDHLRAVVEDPALMARIAAVHALGDIWAMGAQPQAALATIILPRMTAPMQAATLREITQAAQDVLAQAGAVLAGGHTTQGADLTLGFTVTGLAERPITLAGGQPGDALLLTRPIGSGTLLAGEMRGRADGGDMAALYAAMVRPQGDAAALLAPQAHAMTDVTGFGLAGHLLAMLRASGCGAALDLDAVPLHRGAEALAARGIASTLAPSNRADTALHLDSLPDTPRAALLFDPQTCGGLLAAVPEASVNDLLHALSRMGHAAARIGTLRDGPERIALRGA
ncbi:selenide, water dikinase SelD [Meridianimarinicoccus roseus]|uniref:Selenide, water dikinase SelD n=2 Tax=Meridianimarinicoccus roseus TaxID=2072018 RepID=A0A2V2L5Y9_9RHOB|nr:selenide, water dikinase SelD [Meridianimarinicoccus roseus]PWR00808.1 selenide, water dikinase SelD [Meridianimarinicoccus roseus]